MVDALREAELESCSRSAWRGIERPDGRRLGDSVLSRSDAMRWSRSCLVRRPRMLFATWWKLKLAKGRERVAGGGGGSADASGKSNPPVVKWKRAGDGGEGGGWFRGGIDDVVRDAHGARHAASAGAC